MTVRRHLTERLRDPGSDSLFCAPPSPPRRVLGGGDDDNADWVARGLSSSENGSIVALTLRWSSASLLQSAGDRGGGEKARGSPGRGEEDKYRGWKVQGGIDKAQRRREEAEGESIGGRDRDGVPEAGGELGRGGRRRGLGTGRLRGGCPSVAFPRGGSLLPPPGDHCVPVDGDGSNGGYRSRRVIGVISWYHFEATPLLDSETSCNFCTGSFSYRLQQLPGFPSTSIAKYIP